MGLVADEKKYSQQLATIVAAGLHEHARVLRAVALTTTEIVMLQVQLANIAPMEPTVIVRSPHAACPRREDEKIRGLCMNPSPKKILIIEDDHSILDVLCDILTEEGYVVETSIDGASLTVAPCFQPDLILLDVMMPAMDGVEVRHHLKTNPATAHIPIILMTAGGPGQANLKKAKIDDYLSKPFDIDTLLAHIARYLPDIDTAREG